MGGLVNDRRTAAAAWGIAILISGLNVFLLGATLA
jgi:Mn2+/Fe2+ NRAMP family transporter